MTFRGAEQRFLLLFLEKEEYCGLYIAWGQAPKPPGLASLEVLGMYDLPRSGTTFFASFSGKRRILRPREYCDPYITWRQSPRKSIIE
jgi:hypothetical protein